jgi:hypothetical protein
MTKITKRDMFMAVREAAEAEAISFSNEELTFDALIEWCDKEIASLDRKAETAKTKAAEKKAAGDALRERVYEVLDSEPMTIAEVTEAIGDEEVSTNKVAYRLNALVELNMAEKNDAKVTGSDGKTRVVKVFNRI